MIYLFLWVAIGIVFAIVEQIYIPDAKRLNPMFTILAWPGLLFALFCILIDHLIIKAASRCKS